MDDIESIDKQLKEFFGTTNKRWNFGNEILYKMCEGNPKHKDEHVIVGKIWLIGRSYAAAIERTKKEKTTNRFYYEDVAQKVLENCDELDGRIAELNEYERLSRDNLDKALEAHKFLIKVFNKITGKDNHSLASKYLHFHCPSMFYIYDSRAVSAINAVAGKDGLNICKELHKPDLKEYDKDYADFCAKALALQEYIEKEHGQKVTPRDIDNFLLYYCD